MRAASKGFTTFTLSLAGATSLAGLTTLADIAQAATTYLGNAVNYNYGTVQVQITVDSNGKITQIDTPQVSTRGSNASYTNYALPILVSEALKAQSATIQAVSGASYLSRGWIASLASAIAQVGSVTTSTPTPTATPTPIATHSATPTPTATPTVAPRPVISPTARGGREAEGSEHEGSDEENGQPTPIVKSPTPTPTPTVKPTPTPIAKSPTPTATPTSKASATAKATPKPTLVAPVGPPVVLKPGASVIQKTITCVKGATKKVVKALNPKCPAGYTLKKP